MIRGEIPVQLLARGDSAFGMGDPRFDVGTSIVDREIVSQKRLFHIWKTSTQVPTLAAIRGYVKKRLKHLHRAR